MAAPMFTDPMRRITEILDEELFGTRVETQHPDEQTSTGNKRARQRTDAQTVTPSAPPRREGVGLTSGSAPPPCLSGG